MFYLLYKLAPGAADIRYLRWKTSVSGGDDGGGGEGGTSPFSAFRVLCLSTHGKRNLA